ncbi:hypothetical protein [Nitrosococcus watsonii]|uniref:hypothetical protein n=1 Tax=Nitrosococcus watsonii TaxID=473531 RepID=UPI0012F8A9D6|nr:hypothetical protein [Nitrosococcus watsonii]
MTDASGVRCSDLLGGKLPTPRDGPAMRAAKALQLTAKSNTQAETYQGCYLIRAHLSVSPQTTRKSQQH